MKIFPHIRSVLTVALLLAGNPPAAEPLKIDTAGATRLGLEYARAIEVSGEADLAVPARVAVPPAAISAVSAAFDARIEQLWKAQGETVAAGEPLVRLGSPEFVELQAEFLRHRASLDLKRALHERDAALVEAGAIARRRFDETRAALREARVTLSATRARLAAIGMTPEQIDTLAATGGLRESLEIVSPVAGVVLSRSGEVGQRVEAMTLIYRLARTDRLWLEARVPADRAATFAPGQQFQVEGTPAAASVLHVGYGVDADDNTVLVRAAFAQPPGGLRPGQFVMARWQGAVGTTIEIPQSALVHHAGSDFVFVPMDGGVDVREVGIANRTGARARISSGLTAGEDVVVSGTASLKALWLGADGT